jgi:hypothetical protein
MGKSLLHTCISLAVLVLLWAAAGCVHQVRSVGLGQISPDRLQAIPEVHVVNRAGEEWSLSGVEVRGDTLQGRGIDGGVVKLPVDQVAYLSYPDPRANLSTAGRVMLVVVLAPVTVLGLALLVFLIAIGVS